MSERQSSGSATGVLYGIGVIAGIAELAFRPFLLAPIGVLALLIGAMTSSKHRRLGVAAAFILTSCFVIGAGIAVWDSRALY